MYIHCFSASSMKGRTMKKKLTKHGNSFAVIIDKPILNLLSIDEKTTLNISTDGRDIIIRPVRTKKAKISDDPKKQAIYEEIVRKYEPAMRKLAKH